jgi:hypothetical protein
MIPRSHKHQEKSSTACDSPDGETGTYPSSFIDENTLCEDVVLCREIEEAVSELEIITLRNKLKNINKQPGVPFAGEQSIDTDACFGLSEELVNPVKLNLEAEGLGIGNYLQKLHIKNHSITSKEQIHDLYSEGVALAEADNMLMSPEDEMLFCDVKEAVTEKEIIDLRANLQSIAQSVSVHERTFDEIEAFISGDLEEEIEFQIREEAKVNSALSFEIELHSELDEAVEEQDIMMLRASLRGIIQNEYSHSHSVEEIDGYLNDELDGHALALFEDELVANSGLADDLAFHKELDRAIAESDIMALRARLKEISHTQQDLPDEKLGVVSPHKKHLFWYAAASVILLMFVFTSLVKNRNYSSQQLYTAYYQPYKNTESVSRSTLGSYSNLNSALHNIDIGNYHDAILQLKSTPETERDGYSVNFYSGVVYQELGEYNSAINSFTEVVRHGDNLLVEQSEWYIGLCYLRTDEREKALAQFRTIVSRKGYYGEQSRKLLRQLE